MVVSSPMNELIYLCVGVGVGVRVTNNLSWKLVMKKIYQVLHAERVEG